VALVVTIYPEFVSLLKLVAKQEHVSAVIVTCGLRRVWDKVLEREGLSKTVKVIGGGRIVDGIRHYCFCESFYSRPFQRYVPHIRLGV